ncbi:MAG TPA: MarR family transcriptional regulator [Bacillota bacterium]|nr:MarR family transcriptional regulator [Bacillota bacterium]
MTLHDSIGYLINQTGRRMSQYLSFYFGPYDITPEQWGLLNQLAEKDGISQKTLACRVEKDQTNVTRILDQLERKGLVERKPNAEDRRSFLTYVTKEGRELSERLVPIEAQCMKEAEKGLTEEDLTRLKQILKRISQNIDNLR